MPQFKLVKATGDGFIMYKSEVLGVENIRLKERKTLYKWDMTSRELMDVCTITRSLGVDWH